MNSFGGPIDNVLEPLIAVIGNHSEFSIFFISSVYTFKYVKDWHPVWIKKERNIIPVV